MIFSEGADEHIRVKFKKKTNELPDKDTTVYRTPVEFLEGLTRLIYHFKAKGKLYIAKELMEAKRKQPYKEPDIKDFGTPVETVAEDDEPAAVVEEGSSQSRRKASTASRSKQTTITYTLDDNQKLRLRREHGKIQDLEKSDDDDRKESMHWMFAVIEEKHINRIADENPEVINAYEHYKLPALIIDAMVTNMRSTKEQKITMVERLRTKYCCEVFNSPDDARAKIEGYQHIQSLARYLKLPDISYQMLEADTLEAVDGMLEEVQKEILDGREKVKKLKDKEVPHESEEALLPSTYMELVKMFEDYNYTVKSPELAAGSWCNMTTEPSHDKKKKSKCSYCSSNAHYLRVSKDRASELACPKAIEQREKARSDPRRPQNLKDKLRKFKIKI